MLEEMDDEACYLFTPNDDHEITARPSKRRKTSKSGNIEHPCVRLFQGEEALQHVKVRFDAFEAHWDKHESALTNIIKEADDRTAKDIARYILDVKNLPLDDRLAAGLLVGSHDHSSSDHLFSSIKSQIGSKSRPSGAVLLSTRAANLKIALKNLIKQATTGDVDAEDNRLAQGLSSGDHLLNYDLKVLSDHVRYSDIDQILVYLVDSEAFPDAVLSDLISVLHAWSDRIPFMLLFGISTSLDLFEARLPKSILRRMQCTSFEMINVSTQDLLKCTTTTNLEIARSLWSGADLTSTLLLHQKRCNRSNAAFIQAIKYMYMTHFFANPLSALLSPHCIADRSQLAAIRELPSFQAYIEALIRNRNSSAARTLLNDDAALTAFVGNQLDHCHARLSELIKCLESIQIISEELRHHGNFQWSDLYVLALSGKLLKSTFIHDMLLSVRKLSSDKMYNMLSRLDKHIQEPDASGLKAIFEAFQHLLGSRVDKANPLRSEHDTRSSSLRTTLVAQKIELRKDRSTLSGDDLSYTNIIQRIDVFLQGYLEKMLLDVGDLPLHEILVYNGKSVHRDAFVPRPRFAIERALSSPHDYLDCNCCAAASEALSATQPASAILFQLYLESGMLINSADLWSAFYAIVGDDEAEDEEADQQEKLTSFSRAMAELRYLGMIKQSRKRADHLAKLLWKGL